MLTPFETFTNQPFETFTNPFGFQVDGLSPSSKGTLSLPMAGGLSPMGLSDNEKKTQAAEVPEVQDSPTLLKFLVVLC